MQPEKGLYSGLLVWVWVWVCEREKGLYSGRCIPHTVHSVCVCARAVWLQKHK